MFLRAAVLVMYVLTAACCDALVPDSNGKCPNGMKATSVVNNTDTQFADGTLFCAKSPLCRDSSGHGHCPDPDAAAGLPFGSYCGKLQSGFGCLPLSLPSALSMEAGKFEEASVPDCKFLWDLTQVSVENVADLCAPHPICSGKVQGNCPTTLTDMKKTYRCEINVNGVYGCIL